MSDALSKERIAELDSLQLRQIADRYREGGWLTPPEMTQRQAETILALIDERARLTAVAEAAEYATRKFGDQYEGRLGPLNEALAALDAWNAGT